MFNWISVIQRNHSTENVVDSATYHATRNRNKAVVLMNLVDRYIPMCSSHRDTLFADALSGATLSVRLLFRPW